jgi:hypothetical protein
MVADPPPRPPAESIAGNSSECRLTVPEALKIAGYVTFFAGDVAVTSRTETIVRPAKVDFNDILRACKVEPLESFGEPPWEDCDGYRHESGRYEATSRNDVADLTKMWPYLYHERDRVIIDLVPQDGLFKSYRDSGCSKQVDAEMVALHTRVALDQIKNGGPTAGNPGPSPACSTTRRPPPWGSTTSSTPRARPAPRWPSGSKSSRATPPDPDRDALLGWAGR